MVDEAAAPDFSVLCSAYRCEAYLAGTIDSVVAQTHRSWELVVVDNGMSDEIVEIVERYRDDPRVRLIRQENSGLIGGIATAAAAATGRYLVPLDSDDQLTPEFCRRMAAVLDVRPEIDVLSCDAFLFVDGSELSLARSFLRHRTGLEHPLTMADVIGKHDVVPYFATFRREAWVAGGGYAAGTELVEDIGLFLRLIDSRHDVRVLPDRLVRYRMRADSSSRDPSTVETFEHNREQIYIAAARNTENAETYKLLQHRLHGLRYEQALRRARWAFQHGDLAAARAAAGEAHRQRRTARITAILVGTYLAPSLLRRFYPAKQQLTRWVSQVAAKAVARRERQPLR